MITTRLSLGANVCVSQLVFECGINFAFNGFTLSFEVESISFLCARAIMCRNTEDLSEKHSEFIWKTHKPSLMCGF